MDFHTHITYFDIFKQSGKIGKLNIEEFTDYAYQMTLGELIPDQRVTSGVIQQFEGERIWIKEQRPYYRIWPSVSSLLLKTDLHKIPSNFIYLPKQLKSLCILFPKTGNDFGFESEGRFFEVRSILVSKSQQDRFTVMFDYGESYKGFPIFYIYYFKITNAPTIGGCLSDLFDHRDLTDPSEQGVRVPQEIITNCTKLWVTLCMIDEDTQLLTPDVLAKDCYKLTEDLSPRELDIIIQRAHRKGKIGWDVGKELHEQRDIAPHFVNPYFAVRWMGHKDHKEPKLRPISGYWWAKKKIICVPQGYLGNQ